MQPITKARSRIAKVLAKPRVDYFHEQPGSMPGTLNIEADARNHRLN